VAYVCVYLAGTRSSRGWLRSDEPALAWLKHEFNLNDAEFTRIARLHQAYLPQCRERCQQIERINQQLTQAIASATQVTPEIVTILDARGRLQAQCQAAMLKHFFEISQAMPPEQGRRYLNWVQKQTCLNQQSASHDMMGATHGE
jgi:hypothetical protein